MRLSRCLLMTLRSRLRALGACEDLNFLFTNRLPRRWASQAMGRLSRVEQPLVRDLLLHLWKLFCDVDLSDAEERRYRSLHECFTRRLKPGARPVDPDPRVLCSPCDAIVGSCGRVEEGLLLQAKGFPYRLGELLSDESLARASAGARYITLRLTAGMYHRFHSPADAHVGQVDYIHGDTWNVNPIALRRVERLFCRNERAVLRMTLAGSGESLLLVPVAAILVASLRLSFADLHACICGIAAPTASPATPGCRRGRSWAGSNTARR